MIMLASDPDQSGSPARPSGLDFRWIEDEGLLRDEGVLFGLARDEAGLKAKEDCIRAYYECCKAQGARMRAGLLADLGSAPDAEFRTPEIPEQPVGPRATSDSPTALAIRYGIGIAAAGGACVGVGALVYDLLRPVFESGALVTAGVLASGFFTASLPVSLLFVSDGADRPGAVELWKVRLAELGLPLATSLFVVAWAWERLGLLRAATTLILLFLVFAFAGRLLLSSVSFLGRALRTVQAERAESKGGHRDTAVSASQDRINTLRAELSALRSDVEWDAICAARLALFRSEFELASASAAHRARIVPLSVTSAQGSR